MPAQKTRGECGLGKKPSVRILMGMGGWLGILDERGVQFREALAGPLADEAGGDVEIGGRAPLEAGCRAEAIEERFERADHGGGKIEGGEQAHGFRFY